MHEYEAAMTCAGNLAGSTADSRKWLRITSKCRGSWPQCAEPNSDLVGHPDLPRCKEGGPWFGFCPCCKRPLIMELGDSPDCHGSKRSRIADGEGAETAEKCAYVVAIWGTNPADVLGAMVLGWSLRRTGTKHSMVVMHTNDVPAAAVDLLRRSGWTLNQVEYLEGVETLFYHGGTKGRFSAVFTKLRVLGLVQYSKVLLMDADLLVQQNIDEIFDMQAPAAMARGPKHGYVNEQRINGAYFFGGSGGPKPWGQNSGINAGVMLLKPDMDVMNQCLAEVSDWSHPEHIRGNGPEQDYLSRFFADSWRHLDVAYNFQLHQMYFALSPTAAEGKSPMDRVRFLHKPELVKIIHYSSEPKPWARLLDEEFKDFNDEDWYLHIVGKFRGYQSWVQQDRYSIEAEGPFVGVQLLPDGTMRRLGWAQWEFEGAKKDAKEKSDHGNTKPDADLGDDGEPLGDVVVVPEDALKGAEFITRSALSSWEKAYNELAGDLQDSQLAHTVVAAYANAGGINKSNYGNWDVATAKKIEALKAEAAEGASADSKSETSEGGYNAKSWGWGNGNGGRKQSSWPKEASGGTWSCTNGWWFEGAKNGRAVASSALVPQSQAMLSIDGKALLQANSFGVHVANASPAGPSAISFGADANIDSVIAWADAVPKGCTVLVAVIDPHGQAGNILATLASCGLGCPNGTLPPGAAVATAVGPKGDATWTYTNSAPDFAFSAIQSHSTGG